MKTLLAVPDSSSMEKKNPDSAALKIAAKWNKHPENSSHC